MQTSWFSSCYQFPIGKKVDIIASVICLREDLLLSGMSIEIYILGILMYNRICIKIKGKIKPPAVVRKKGYIYHS